MHTRPNVLAIAGMCLASFLPSAILAANEFNFTCGSQPTCGKVCQLVCETKKLTAVCYGCECDEICIPAPSRPGCKHCTTCGVDSLCGECEPACTGCQTHTPACEFCWRDWFACGCAKPRTVKVLTKYQTEKEIGWYHWEVVDAACCRCVADSDQPARHRGVYKPAPADAELGDILPVSDEEWSELSMVLEPDKKDSPAQVASESARPAAEEPMTPTAEPERISIMERLGRLLSR